MNDVLDIARKSPLTVTYVMKNTRCNVLQYEARDMVKYMQKATSVFKNLATRRRQAPSILLIKLHMMTNTIASHKAIDVTSSSWSDSPVTKTLFVKAFGICFYKMVHATTTTACHALARLSIDWVLPGRCFAF